MTARLSTARLIALYRTHSLRETGRALGVSRTTVSRILAAHGVPRRGKQDQITRCGRKPAR